MGERVNDAAREAAHDSDPYIVPCPQCKAPEYVACETPEPHPLRIIDAAIEDALPHLTAEDVPHIAAQVYREAAIDAGAVVQGTRLMRAASLFRATAVANVMRALRARADRLDDGGHA